MHAMVHHLPQQIRDLPIDIQDASGSAIEQVNQKRKRGSKVTNGQAKRRNTCSREGRSWPEQALLPEVVMNSVCVRKPHRSSAIKKRSVPRRVRKDGRMHVELKIKIQ